MRYITHHTGKYYTKSYQEAISHITSDLMGFLHLINFYMADNKKTIVVYTDWIHQFEPLTDEEAGKLIKHFFRYVNDQNPDSDRMTELLFTPIKHQLKRDLIKWETTLEGRSKAGKASAEARKLAKEQGSTNSTNVESVEENSTNSTDNVNDNVNDILLEKETKGEVIDWVGLLNRFNQITGRKFKVIDDKTKRQFKARLKDGYSKHDILAAIKNCFNDPYHKENPHFLTPEFISRSDKMQKYATKSEKPTTTNKKEIGML